MPEEATEPTRKEVLDEIRHTRYTLENLPKRLSDVEKQSNKLVWSIIGLCLVIVVTALFFLWNENRHNKDQNDKFDNFAFCQAEYNRVNSIVSKTRAELNTELNAAQATRDGKIAKIVSSGKGDINAVFKDYSTALAKIETKRADNPLPSYPECYDKYITHEQPGPSSTDS